MRVRFNHGFEEIISVDNLLCVWKEFLRGKKNKKDVCEFSLHLMDNILELHRDLATKTYTHHAYHAFKINDPKTRDIHKATVRDRLLHYAIYRTLYQYFDKKFIYDSYSCRNGKGTHKAMNRFRSFVRKVSKNNTKTCFVLKCDIRKFFASINHRILIEILKKHIQDENIIWLLNKIINSFSSSTIVPPQSEQYYSKSFYKELPLGNLTSQLFANVYLNELDHFIKHKLKIKYYIRYADDFVVLSGDKRYLESLISTIREFLAKKLKLELHPKKVFIKTFALGMDFLGWVHFPKFRVLRTTTKRRMIKKLNSGASDDTINSYLGILKHGNAHKLISKINDKLK